MDGLPFPLRRTPSDIDSEGVRQQINEETSFLDLSFVYGNNQARLDLARADLPGEVSPRSCSSVRKAPFPRSSRWQRTPA